MVGADSVLLTTSDILANDSCHFLLMFCRYLELLEQYPSRTINNTM